LLLLHNAGLKYVRWFSEHLCIGDSFNKSLYSVTAAAAAVTDDGNAFIVISASRFSSWSTSLLKQHQRLMNDNLKRRQFSSAA